MTRFFKSHRRVVGAVFALLAVAALNLGCDNCTRAQKRAGACGYPEKACTIAGLERFPAKVNPQDLEDDPLYPQMCEYAQAISTADAYLDQFNGLLASENYQRAIEFAASTTAINPAFNTCRPTYGKLLGEIQQLLFLVNDLLEYVVALATTGGAEAIADGITSKPGRGGFSALQTIDFDFEFGQLLLNFYDGSIRKKFESIAELHDRLENLPDCEFVANNTHALAFNPNAFVEPGVPLRLFNNKSLAQLENEPEALMLELRMGIRWDVTEVRIARFFVDVIRGILYSIVAHDLTIDEEQVLQGTDWALKIFNQGSNLLDIVECGGLIPGVSSSFFGSDISLELEQEACENDVANGVIESTSQCNFTGVVDTNEECRLAVRETVAPLTLAQHFRSLGFIADNPQTFTRHSVRWTPYMSEVDNHLAESFAAAANLVAGMVQRSVRYASDIAIDQRLAEFSFLFEDNNEDGILNGGDRIGFQVQPSIKLKLPQSILDALGIDESGLGSLTNTLNLLLPQVLQQTVPNDEYVRALQTSVETLRDQFLSVDNTDVVSTPFALTTLQPVISASFLFGEEPIPDALAFDFGRGFRASSDATDLSPVPLRELMPYWEAVPGETPQGAFVIINEFIIEEELLASAVTTAPWQNTDVVSVPGATGDARHFKTGANAYWYFNPKGVTNSTAQVFFDGLASPLDYDCDSPESHPDSDIFAQVFGVQQGLMYFYFQDPSFNGALLTKLSGVAGISACPNDSGKAGASGNFETADLYSMHRAFIAVTAWFNNNFVISELLGFFE